MVIYVNLYVDFLNIILLFSVWYFVIYFRLLKYVVEVFLIDNESFKYNVLFIFLVSLLLLFKFSNFCFIWLK